MQITTTNGSITSIQQTVSPESTLYVLPDSITATGATLNYDSSTGTITLTNITGDIVITAKAIPDAKTLVTYEDLDEFKNQILSIILKYRCGYYDPNIMYDIGDSVFYNKQIYVCISNTLGGVPPTDTSYWSLLIVKEPTLISFSVNGTSYQAEEGMTWEQWINSTYSAAGYIISSGLIVYVDANPRRVLYNNTSIESSDIIVEGRAYTLSSAGGGDN